MKKLYVVRLAVEERSLLKALVNTGRVAAYRRRHAQLLRLVDQGEQGPAYSDRDAAEHVSVSRQTVESVRRRCVLEGLDSALERRKRNRERSVVL
ncbi:MAG: helix-turn-helix domain-containing protein [Gammaproteobacteria bacterium]